MVELTAKLRHGHNIVSVTVEQAECSDTRTRTASVSQWATTGSPQARLRPCPIDRQTHQSPPWQHICGRRSGQAVSLQEHRKKQVTRGGVVLVPPSLPGLKAERHIQELLGGTEQGILRHLPTTRAPPCQWDETRHRHKAVARSHLEHKLKQGCGSKRCVQHQNCRAHGDTNGEYEHHA